MPKRVLVCDDEPYIVESVSYVVRRAGFEVLTAEDGDLALQTAIRERPGLVFLDIMMPGLAGDEICRRLKSDPATRDIHVVILTARGQEEDERRALEFGADAFMTKPFSPRKLRDLVLRVLGDPLTS
jgi:DNA-binding response OmpR family regulator